MEIDADAAAYAEKINAGRSGMAKAAIAAGRDEFIDK